MSFGEVFLYLLDGFRYTCLIFFFTLIFAYVLLGERLNVPQVACVGLALFGVAISSMGKKD